MNPPPEALARVADLMAGFPGTWSVCGGWGIDSWLGYQTRNHDDVDVAVFEDDQDSLFARLGGWLLIAHDQQVPDDTTERWNGRRLHLPAHVHARSDDDFELELLLNERTDGDWLLGRDPRVTVPIGASIGESHWGLPTAAPEVLLWFKATAYFDVEGMHDRAEQDERDFLAILPAVTHQGLTWFRDALRLAHPDHPWLERAFNRS